MRDEAEHILDGGLNTSKVVDYSKLTLDEKRAKAIEDIISWMGMNKFVDLQMKILGAFKEEGRRPTVFEWKMLMYTQADMDGYPTVAWYEFIFGEGAWQEQKDLQDAARAGKEAAQADNSQVAPQP